LAQVLKVMRNNGKIQDLDNFGLIVYHQQPMVTMKKPVVGEYYNLRGQKLPLYGLKHADGIVFERKIGPAGTTRERKLAAQKN
jgi:hypothetical protein